MPPFSRTKSVGWAWARVGALADVVSDFSRGGSVGCGDGLSCFFLGIRVVCAVRIFYELKLFS